MPCGVIGLDPLDELVGEDGGPAHVLAGGGPDPGHAFAGAFPDAFAFHLGEGADDLRYGGAGDGGGVDTEVESHQRPPLALSLVKEGGEVRDAAAEAVDLGHGQRVGLPCLQVVECCGKDRAATCTSGPISCLFVETRTYPMTRGRVLLIPSPCRMGTPFVKG